MNTLVVVLGIAVVFIVVVEVVVGGSFVVVTISSQSFPPYGGTQLHSYP